MPCTGDALVQVAHLGEQALDDGLAVAGQILQVMSGFASDDLGLLGQHDARTGERVNMWGSTGWVGISAGSAPRKMWSMYPAQSR